MSLSQLFCFMRDSPLRCSSVCTVWHAQRMWAPLSPRQQSSPHEATALSSGSGTADGKHSAARDGTGCRTAGDAASAGGRFRASSCSCMLNSTDSHRKAGAGAGGESEPRVDCEGDCGSGAGRATADAAAARAATASILCFRFLSRFRALRTASFSAALRSLKGRAARRCSSAGERREGTWRPSALRNRSAAKREGACVSLMAQGVRAASLCSCRLQPAVRRRGDGSDGCADGFCAGPVRVLCARFLWLSRKDFGALSKD